MNRFKKELNKHGYKMEKDYDSMPYQTADNFIEAISVNSETAVLSIYYLSIDLHLAFDRQMHAHYLDLDTDIINPKF